MTTRDWEFAKTFGLPIIEVVAGGDVEKEAYTDCGTARWSIPVSSRAWRWRMPSRP